MESLDMIGTNLSGSCSSPMEDFFPVDLHLSIAGNLRLPSPLMKDFSDETFHLREGVTLLDSEDGVPRIQPVGSPHEEVQMFVLPHHWDLYYHLPHDKNWEVSSYKLIMSKIKTVEELIALNENISENIVKYCMLFVMRNGITPQWEDPQNRHGGAFSFKVINKQVYEVWKYLFYHLCTETLFVDVPQNAHINGITISPKKNFCIIKIWLDTCKLQDPDIIIDIPNLQKQGCIFKKHEPEF